MTILRQGLELEVNRDPSRSVVFAQLNRMNLDQGVRAFVTFCDSKGVSMYVDRSTKRGGYMEIFIPRETMWSAYFKPNGGFNPNYSTSRHFTKIFPQQC